MWLFYINQVSMIQLAQMAEQHLHFEHDFVRNGPLKQLLTLLQQLELLEHLRTGHDGL